MGGDWIETSHICPPTGNPHFVEIVPSQMVTVGRADIYLKVGMGLDLWADRIIDGSRNRRLLVVDCSVNVNRLEIPTGKVDASMGDVHPEGNPHYWLDPANGILIARTIAVALMKVDPPGSDAYQSELERFITDMDLKMAEWRKTADALRGLKIVTYHNSWPYFARAFGLELIGFIEPFPGIEPTPSHIADLTARMKAAGVRVIGKEPYFESRTPRALALAIGAIIIELTPSVGGAPGVNTYPELFDYLIAVLNRTVGKSQ